MNSVKPSLSPRSSAAFTYASQPAATLRRLHRLAKLMDAAYRVPGTNYRLGWDALLGLFPGAGDLITGLASLVIVAYAWRLGVRKSVIARMLANVGIDVAVGSLPVIGDLFDATFKANLRNVALLERDLARRR